MFKRFLHKVNEFLEKKLVFDTDQIVLLSHLNPEKFSVDEVRNIFNISARSAKLYCDTAVRQGTFSKIAHQGDNFYKLN